MDGPYTPDWLKKLEEPSLPPLIQLIRLVQHNSFSQNDEFCSLLDDACRANPLFSPYRNIESFKSLIVQALNEGLTPKEIVTAIDWKAFEQLTASFLIYSGYSVIQNYRFKSVFSAKKNLEIDIIAQSKASHEILLIDCKRYKTPSQAPVRLAVQKQIDRCHQLMEQLSFIHGDPRLQFTEWDFFTLYPVMVTWRDHSIRFHLDVPIVPIENFLDFIANFSEYREFLWKFSRKI